MTKRKEPDKKFVVKIYSDGGRVSQGFFVEEDSAIEAASSAKELAEKGISIMLITHDMQLTLEYCDRAIVLSGGEKIADDKPSQILTDKNIITKANLKETSLSPLARSIDIANTNDFVQFFIDLER